jgi:hypothetical protein
MSDNGYYFLSETYNYKAGASSSAKRSINLYTPTTQSDVINGGSVLTGDPGASELRLNADGMSSSLSCSGALTVGVKGDLYLNSSTAAVIRGGSYQYQISIDSGSFTVRVGNKGFNYTGGDSLNFLEWK